MRAINLDLFNFSRLDLIKIDVEGMELEVLAGGAKCIGDLHPILVVEAIKTDKAKLRAWLDERGYAVLTGPMNFFAIHKDDKALAQVLDRNWIRRKS